MSASMIACGVNHGTTWVADYMANVPAIIHRFGGVYTAVPQAAPGAIRVVEGEAPAPDWIVLFTFPSIAAIEAFLASPEYSPYRDARKGETESIFYAFENDEALRSLFAFAANFRNS